MQDQPGFADITAIPPAPVAVTNLITAYKQDITVSVNLPDEVERALLREAGFADPRDAPPPIVLTSPRFDVAVRDLAAEIPDTDEMREIMVQIRAELSRDLTPQARESFRAAIRR